MQKGKAEKPEEKKIIDNPEMIPCNTWPVKKSAINKAGLNKIANEARRNGFIALDNLYLIMAEDESYGDVLCQLWNFFQCGRRSTRVIDGNSEASRIGLWFDLLHRWCGFGLLSEGLEAVRLLPLFKNTMTGLRKVTYIGHEKGPYFVKLKDLKEYLESIQKEHKISLPLPKMLFSEATKKATCEVAENDAEKDYDHAEKFIRSLRFTFENDFSIKIRLPPKPGKIFTYAEMGFRSIRTKTWKALMETILDVDDPTLDLGYAWHDTKNKVGRVNHYDAMQKILSEINRKLLDFFKKTYGIPFPPGFKVYERLPSDRPGTYRFKIGVNRSNGR